MSEKVVDLHKEQQKADRLFDAANLNISQKRNNTEKVLSADILNDTVEFQLAEAELTKPTCYEMTLKLTSSKCASLSLAKDGVEIGEDIEDDDKLLTFHDLRRPQDEIGFEVPFREKLYGMLAQCMSYFQQH